MDTENSENTIREDDYLLIIDNRNNRVIVSIKKDKTTSIRKKKIKLKDLVGFTYESTFEVDKNGQIKLVSTQQAEPFEEDNLEEIEKEDEAIEQLVTETADANDNSTMVDNNKAQKLSANEIEQMKKEGVDGQQIIQKLLENSESFNKRTAFSQEKYLSKKRQKHLLQFKVYRVTLDSLAETYFLKNSSYIMSFRYDSLALFLQFASVDHTSRVLLFDNTHGLALAGVRQRAGATAEIVVCSPKGIKQAPKEFRIANEIGYTEEDLKNVQYVTLSDIEANPDQKFSHILIASEAVPVEILEHTIKYLVGSGTIVVFSSFIEALGDCFDFLKQGSQGINLHLHEVFSREQQVLPDRTHPHMVMQSFSGFIFAANKAIN